MVNLKLNLRTGFVAFVTMLIVGVGGYFGWQFQHNQWLLKNPSAATEEETNNVLRKVGNHVALPVDEKPTVAVVSDLSKLAGQPFFALAKVGDRVLIYALASRAILYRPETDRVIEMTMINQPTAAPEAQLSEANLVIYNSTKTVGLAIAAEKKILERFNSFKIVTRTNSIGVYKKSMIIVLNSRARNLAMQLAGVVNAELVEKLPVGENKPEGDMVLILGEDFK